MDLVTPASFGHAGRTQSAAAPKTAPTGWYARGLKRAFDVAAILLASVPVIVVLLPLLAIVSLDGHRPIYTQDRIGRGGRVFRIYKLRTMVPDAEAALQSLLERDPEARAEWDHHQKLRNDPRITSIGALLRRTSLDELPQLLNVLKGDMSLVGPRPMMPDQRDLYPGSEYFELRPGVTGLWQISERNRTSFADRASFDRRYLQDLSFGTDLGVLLGTVRVVLRGTGC